MPYSLNRPDDRQQETQMDKDALEKDLFYYRQTNRDLKAKLRELVTRNQKLQMQLKGHPSLQSDVPVAAE